jgi:hypothetical protein
MLVEFQNVRQIPEDGFRRYFTDGDFDLYVWYADRSMVTLTGFQLCYNKQTRQKALTWNNGAGFLHTAIDDGESSPLKNQTPILVSDGTFAKDRVLKSFIGAAKKIDPKIVSFVTETISRYPQK